MSALYLVGTDKQYFDNKDDIEKFKGFLKVQIIDFEMELDKIDKIVFKPSNDDIKNYISDESVAFLDWVYPSSCDLEVLVVKELPFVNDILTTQEIDFGVSERDSLKQKLQLEIIETNKSYKNLAGADFQISIIEEMYKSFETGRLSKLTMFLLGIPGAGKTYLAECIAGEKDRLLVKLDLALIMEMDRPIFRLHYFFKWLEILNAKGTNVVVLLDEIAQAITGNSSIQNQFKGQLLTIIEDLNTKRGYQVGSTFFIATDNNIRDIMNQTPQFMARWVEAFFINFPKEIEAKAILKMYLNHHKAILEKHKSEIDDDDLHVIYTTIEGYFFHDKIEYNGDEKRFIYSPREIEKFASRFATMTDNELAKKDYVTQEVIMRCCKRVPPQQNMLKIGITEMVNDAGKGFIEI